MEKVKWLCVIKLNILVLVMSTISASGVYCQRTDQVKLQGQVISSKDGQPVVGATIIIKLNGIGIAADKKGNFSIELPSDSSIIIVSSIGYTSREIKINPSLNLTSYVIILDEDVKLLDEVTVVAEKDRIVRISENFSSVKISPILVTKLPSMGEVDVMRSFQLLPGVSATNETSAGLYVRGGTPDQNLILFDGMTIYHVDHFYGFFSAFNANTIDDIELMKGGFPAKYGGRTSSVMEITGKPADLVNANGTATVSLLSVNGAIEIPIVKNKLSLQLAARRSYTDVIRTGLYKKIFNLYSQDENSSQTGGNQGMRMFQQQEQQPSFYFYDMNSKLSYKISDKNMVAISFYSGKDNLDNSRDASSGFGGFGGAAPVTSSSTDIASWGNYGISGQWKANWVEKFKSTVFISYSNYFSNRNQNSGSTDSTGTFSSQMNTLEDNNVNDLSLRLNNEWTINSFNKLEFGFENTSNHITYSLVYNDTATMMDKNNYGNQSSFYLQDKINLLNKKIIVNVGTRVTYQDVTEKIYFEPRFSISYQLSKVFKISSAWGIYNQLCTRVIREDVLQGSKDFWLLADGNTIPVSSATHYILGASYEKGDYLINVEAYYKDMEGLTEYSYRTTRSIRQAMTQQEYFFEGNGYAKGIEILLQKKYGLNTGWISYTLSEVKHTFADLNYGKPFYASHDQPNEFKGVYSRKIKKWDISATFVYATGKPYTAPESQYEITMLDGSKYEYIHVSDKYSLRLPDYHKLDLSVSYNWSGIMADKTLSLSIFNVYNHKNIWYKKYDIQEDEISVTNVNYLGFTPNVSFTIKFK
jgi:hypothetical protein